MLHVASPVFVCVCEKCVFIKFLQVTALLLMKINLKKHCQKTNRELIDVFLWIKTPSRTLSGNSEPHLHLLQHQDSYIFILYNTIVQYKMF